MSNSRRRGSYSKERMTEEEGGMCQRYYASRAER